MTAISPDHKQLSEQIKQWGKELGFQQVGITDADLTTYEPRFQAWLTANWHGEMQYMEAHGSKRTHPPELMAGTLRVISVRLDYLPADTALIETLQDPNKAYISR